MKNDVIVGNAGKYKSVTNGPKADKVPRNRTKNNFEFLFNVILTPFDFLKYARYYSIKKFFS